MFKAFSKSIEWLGWKLVFHLAKVQSPDRLLNSFRNFVSSLSFNLGCIGGIEFYKLIFRVEIVVDGCGFTIMVPVSAGYFQVVATNG